MIEKQINGDPSLNYDPAKGEVKAPFFLGGPICGSMVKTHAQTVEYGWKRIWFLIALIPASAGIPKWPRC